MFENFYQILKKFLHWKKKLDHNFRIKKNKNLKLVSACTKLILLYAFQKKKES